MHTKLSKYFVYYPIYFMVGEYKLPQLLKAFSRTQWLTKDELLAHQWEKFRKVVNLCYDNIPLYKDSFSNRGIHPSDIKSLDDITLIPILEKKDIMAHASQRSGKQWSLSYKRHTSGSSGTPLYFYKDPSSLAVMDAIMHRNYSWYGIDIGDAHGRFWLEPMAPFRRWKSRAKDRLLNRVRLSPIELSATRFEAFHAQMKSFGAQYIYGYGQSVYEFAKYFRTKGHYLTDLHLKAVILTGEMIFPAQIAEMESTFGCKVAIEYGCTEVGVIGMTCPSGNMHLMTDNLLIETVETSGTRPYGDGKEIIVTELLGGTFPFLRYRLGDRGLVDPDVKCPCGRNLSVMRGLEGRKDDFIICPSGKKVDPYSLDYIMRDMASGKNQVSQFRITQKDLNTLHVQLVIENNARHDLLAALKSKFSSYLDEEMRIYIEAVDNLDRDKSGKLRCFISEIEGHDVRG